MSNNGNSKFTQIYAHGTSSALEPSYITHTSLVGPASTPLLQDVSPYRYIDVNVDLTGAVAGSIYKVGSAVPHGSVITHVFMNGSETVAATTVLAFGVAHASVGAEQTVPTNFVSLQAYPSATLATAVGTDVNSGLSFTTITTPLVSESPVAGYALYPVLTVTSAPAYPVTSGTVNVKIAYFVV
jgi:hypothetical protein